MKVTNYLLGYENMHIIQDTEMFNFSLDSILLPKFMTIRKSDKKILDIGCGNAPIPLILSTITKAQIIGIEIQKEVYELGAESVNINKLSNQIQLIHGDINELYKDYESDTFDAITCNPPYFKITSTSKLNDNTCKTIARHEIKLNIEQVFLISKKLLKNNGVLALVHRPSRLVEILNLMKKYNIEPKKIQFVYPKKGQNANILLIEGRKNGKGELKILDPLYVHDEDGKYTKEMNKFFE